MTSDVDKSLVVRSVRERFGDFLLDAYMFKGDTTLVIEKNSIVKVCEFLKDEAHFGYNFLTDIVGVDYFPRTPRFEVVYQLYSINHKCRVRLKVVCEEGETVPSMAFVWKSANWSEREAYDMFGIVFEGHPDLRRIYMPDGYEDFPLRKDFPLKGYKDKYNPFGEERK